MVRSAGERSVPAFTLLELLVVIAILGILAALAGPTLNSFKPNVMAAATTQLVSDIGRARQLAIANRTTVYMIFVPTNFYEPSGPYSRLPLSQGLTQGEREKADKLLDKQLIGYNFVSVRSLGDQPGAKTTRYLSSWRTLPEGTFIAMHKFARGAVNPLLITNQVTGQVFKAYPFAFTNNIPFPSETVTLYTGVEPFVELPYIAFNYQGQLVSQQDEVIPLGRGSVMFGRDASKVPTKRPPSIVESPAGNTTNSAFHLVYVDWLTGRARAERQEVR